MSTRYYVRADGRKRPYYLCDRERAQRNAPNCQIIPGTNIDKAIGELLVEMVTPVSLEVALTVQGEIQSRLEEASRLRNRQVERARYEADLARQRFMNVDPLCGLHRNVAPSV